MTINQWINANHNPNATRYNADQILEGFGFTAGNFWLDILAMSGFIVAFYIIGYAGLYIRVRQNR